MIPGFKLNNGVEVPQIGLGTFLAKGADIEQAVIDAIEVGYRSIDTAMYYFNEEDIGRGIKKCGLPREKLFISTKLWNDSHGYDKTLRAFDESLKRLGLEYVDQYLIHWPLVDETYVDSWRAFERLYKDGRVRSIGVSNFTKFNLQILFDRCSIKPMVDQIEYNPQFQPVDLAEFCRMNDIMIEAWRPVLHGKLQSMEAIMTLSEKYKKSPVQVTLRWLNQKGIRTLPKSVHKERMIENADIFDFELSQEECAEIDKLNKWIRTGESPDEFMLM